LLLNLSKLAGEENLTVAHKSIAAHAQLLKKYCGDLISWKEREK
jgi:hypothetical protein